MQYLITKDQRDNLLQIMRTNMQDPDAYDAIAEIESLPVLEGEPVAYKLNELLGQYWDIAYEEGQCGEPNGSAANDVLHKIRQLFPHPMPPIAGEAT